MSRAIHLMLHCLNAYEFKFLARIFSDLASYMVIHTVCWRVYIRSNISPEFSHCSAFTLTKLNFYSCSIYPALVHASTSISLQPPMLKTHHVKNISIVPKAKPIYWPPNYMYYIELRIFKILFKNRAESLTKLASCIERTRTNRSFVLTASWQ